MIFEKYDEYTDSEVDWLRYIPNEWKVKRTKDIVKYIDQGWSPVAENRIVESDEWGVLKLSAIKGGKFNQLEHKALSEYTIPNKLYKVNFNEILLSRSNTPQLVGDACFINKINLNLIYSDLIYKLKPNPFFMDGRFIVYVLICKNFRKQIVSNAKGLNTSMVKISQQSIKNWLIFIPILETQIKVANYLDIKTKKIDDEITLLEQKIKKYQELKQTLINETVLRGLDKSVELKDSEIEWIGDIPEDWKTDRLKNIFDERVGKNLNKKTDEAVTNNILSVMKDVGVINHRDKGNVGNKMSEDITNYKLVFPDDIVVNKMNIMIGSVGISKEFGALSVIYIILITKKGSYAKYYNYFFKMKAFQRSLRRIATGILEIREAVNMTLFMQEMMTKPPLEEQIKIANYLDEKTTKIDTITKTIKDKIDVLKEFRKTLINDVVTGKVKVEDEV